MRKLSMRNNKEPLYRFGLLLTLLIIVLTLQSCGTTGLRATLIKSDAPGYFDKVEGNDFKGFIIPESYDKGLPPPVCRVPLTLEDVLKAEEMMRAKFPELEDSVEYHFNLKKYWRQYEGLYNRCPDPTSGKKVVILLSQGKMPEKTNKEEIMGHDMDDGQFYVTVDFVSGTVDLDVSFQFISIPYKPNKKKR